MTECCRGDGACGCGEVGLIDMSNVPLRDLKVEPDTALGRSIARLVEDAKDPNGVLAAFDSFVE
jgi:FXSXX-COOH protein